MEKYDHTRSVASELSPDFKRILEAGNSAPSGENCQPWRFLVRGEVIEVHLRPERDQSAYSWGQRASYTACGAVIENMVVAASAEGYRADVAYFPDGKDVQYVADVSLRKDTSVQPDPLAAFVMKRVTNRKPYAKEALAESERRALYAAAEAAHGRLALAESREDLDRLGRVGSTNEEVMLANRSLHRFFFSHVSWTKQEDERRKVGFYIETLELPPPAKVLFRVFRHWPLMRLLAALGFNRVVAAQNAAVNASASAIGALTISGTEPLDFVKTGRAMERLWLTATSLGLSLQPLTGVLFFKLNLDGGEEHGFSLREQKLITKAYQDASQVFQANGAHIAFMFRVGRGDAPSAQAIRFPLTETEAG